jgi:hypothetical protein
MAAKNHADILQTASLPKFKLNTAGITEHVGAPAGWQHILNQKLFNDL